LATLEPVTGTGADGFAKVAARAKANQISARALAEEEGRSEFIVVARSDNKI
jgi:hypothetical protein